MKQSGICPKCQHTRLWHVAEVAIQDHDTRILRMPLALAVVPLENPKDGHTFANELGSFEAYVCEGCGFTEWHANVNEEFRRIPDPAKHGIRLLVKS